jgi:hypothetical protein
VKSDKEAQRLVAEIADQLGMGILVSSVDEGPPCRITAVLSFGIAQTEVSVEGDDPPTAWRELARAAAAWSQSNAVSVTRNFWGG